jgi:hypothetical protein
VLVGTLLIAAAYASAWLPGGAPVWGVCLMIAGSAKIIASATAMGAANSGVRSRLALAAAFFLFAVIVAGFGAPLLLPVETATSPLMLGLPLRAAIEIYGVGLLPIMVLPLLYALEFKSDGLDEASLDALRTKCEALRARSRP